MKLLHHIKGHNEETKKPNEATRTHNEEATQHNVVTTTHNEETALNNDKQPHNKVMASHTPLPMSPLVTDKTYVILSTRKYHKIKLVIIMHP